MDDGDGGFSLGKKNSSKSSAGAGEVDYRTKAGTAWSHNFLNQKPWHPLSYPNQRRKWIAEQTHANRERRTEEVAREFAQEQEFFRQSALFSKKEKEKVEMMKAVSFMYVRPPGYNPESAKAAEVAEERKKLDQNNAGQDPTSTAPVTDTKPDTKADKKARPKDVFGRSLPTEEEFEVLKNAPRLETGMPARVKPFGIEIRNVRCVRCGAFGHQSGDRECPLKDAIMPNEESRLKRDDPLTAILAQTDSSEPLKWELKQKPGMSPPRGGFQPDDPNQQIVAEEIFDEYGGFLSGGHIPALISNFSTKKSQKHSKHKNRHKQRSAYAIHNEPKHRYRDRSASVSDTEDDRGRKREKNKHKKKKRYHSESSRSGSSDFEHCRSRSSFDSEDDRERKRKGKDKKKKRHHSETSRSDGPHLERRGHSSSSSSAGSEEDRKRERRAKNKHKENKRGHFESNRCYSSDSEHRGFRSFDSEDDRERKKAARDNKKTKRYLESGRPDGLDLKCRRNRFSSDSEVDGERSRRAKGKHKEEDLRNSYRHNRGRRC